MATKKMLLVPPEAFISQLDPFTKKMSELDVKMNQILQRKDLDDFNKAMQYQQNLNEFLSVRAQLLKPTPIPIVDASADPPTQQIPQPEANKIQGNIVKSVPKNLKDKADRLVGVIEQVPGLTWNERGEMILNGRVFQGSHYVDLVNDVLRLRKSKIPIGWEAFANALNKVNIPQAVEVRKKIYGSYQSLL